MNQGSDRPQPYSGGCQVIARCVQALRADADAGVAARAGSSSPAAGESHQTIVSSARGSTENRNEALILSGVTHAQEIFQTEEGKRLTHTLLEQFEEYG